MQAPITLYKVDTGAYDEDNNFIPGAKVASTVYGVIVAGNKFSQFDEGISLHSMDGGARYSNYRNLYIQEKYQVSIGDKMGFRGAYYNVLQESDEQVYGFSSFILEKSDEEEAP
jgi:hypothetical protein